MANVGLAVDQNIHIIDAPAGSGKTYNIRTQITDYLLRNPHERVLAITYTNRAADEIRSNVQNNQVYVSTIHAFINDLIGPFFRNSEVVNLYLEKYRDKIQQMLRGKEPKDKRRNERYEEKYGELSWKTIQTNLRKTGIRYGESSFTAYYYGYLSHDDLLIFAAFVAHKLPKINFKISKQFGLIIIDEYQDTMEDVLSLFFSAVTDTGSELYLYGDPMQQIYQKYSIQMIRRMEQLDRQRVQATNYRSCATIIDLLNKIDDEPSRAQLVPDEVKIKGSDFKPRAIFLDQSAIDSHVHEIIESEEANRSDSQTLALYVFNRERFETIGAPKLLKAYSGIYGYLSKIQPKDVLLELDPGDNPDDMMQILLRLLVGATLLEKAEYGQLIRLTNKGNQIFNEQLMLQTSTDKARVKEFWQSIARLISEPHLTIGDFLGRAYATGALKPIVKETMEDERYEQLLKVELNELENLRHNIQNFSTQHGVKGESHESVIFVAEDSGRYAPYLNMYGFLNLWSNKKITLHSLESFALKYRSEISVLNRENRNVRSIEIAELEVDAKQIMDKFADDEYFKALVEDDYRSFITRPLRKSVGNVMKPDFVDRVLTAYKLFYVGCSRARRNLTLILDKDKVSEFEPKLRKKLIEVGFDVK